LALAASGLELTLTERYSYNWGTARGNLKVKQGAWYFEVNVQSGNKIRIGWITDQYEPSKDHGIGNDQNSWGIDGNNQKKFHNDTNGSSYGEYWAGGDVIGCLLDLDANRIIYFKNGKEMGVAFYNLSTKDWFRPAASLSSYYDTCKVTINFGPNFRSKPAGCSGLNPTLSNDQEKSILLVFNKFAENDMITGEGIQKVAMEFGATGPEDPVLSCIAWKLRSEDMWVFRKQEWLGMWARERAYNMDEMKKAARRWVDDLKTERVFINFYNWIFEYLKPVGATIVPADSALSAWRITGIAKKWGWFADWSEWLVGSKRNVDKDTWKMMLSFVDKVGTDLKKYDEMDFWPPHYEDFIQAMIQKKKKS